MFTKIKGTQTWLDYYYVAAFRKPYISLHKPYVSLRKVLEFVVGVWVGVFF